MFRKIGFGFLWFVAMNIVAAVLIGGIAGFIAGLGHTDVSDAYEAGHVAGASLARIKPYVFVGSAILSAVGAATGFLPGTRKRPEQPSREA